MPDLTRDALAYLLREDRARRLDYRMETAEVDALLDRLGASPSTPAPASPGREGPDTLERCTRDAIAEGKRRTEWDAAHTKRILALSDEPETEDVVSCLRDLPSLVDELIERRAASAAGTAEPYNEDTER